jgi:pimeloyl-ACP methyl ester carboxylesterase
MNETIAAITLFTLAATALPAGEHASQAVESLGIDLERYAYPFPVAWHTFPSQGQTLRMAYMEVLPLEPNGRTVTLLHGKNFCGAYWERTARDIAASGFRVVIPDQVGFGKSSKPEHYYYSFHQLAANTRGLLEGLGVRNTSILGHSRGYARDPLRFDVPGADRNTDPCQSHRIGRLEAKGTLYAY